MIQQAIERFGFAFLKRFGKGLDVDRRKAFGAIATCRTAARGRLSYQCLGCGERHFLYRGCGNRHCPICQSGKAAVWLENWAERLPETPCFVVTFTLPSELRQTARRRPREVYDAMFRAGSAALAELTADPRRLGAQVGMLGVLHTWARDLAFHPHVHFVVTGGGLDAAGEWKRSSERFLVPGKPLARLFRGKMRAALGESQRSDKVAAGAWKKDWCVDISPPKASGLRAFRYLSRYVFRVAIGDHRILKVDDLGVTFQYRPSGEKQWRAKRLDGVEFLRRFFEHILPKGFRKVRAYGLLSPRSPGRLNEARKALALIGQVRSPAVRAQELIFGDGSLPLPRCPKCGAPMFLETWAQWLFAPPLLRETIRPPPFSTVLNMLLAILLES